MKKIIIIFFMTACLFTFGKFSSKAYAVLGIENINRTRDIAQKVEVHNKDTATQIDNTLDDNKKESENE